MQTPVTRQRIRDHFGYSWWKYALLIILAYVGWDIFYSVTAYRPPEEKKVILGVYAYGSQENLTQWMGQVQREYLPDMEQVEPMYIVPDATYGAAILMTRVASNECDMYVLPTENFQTWADQGACQALDEILPQVVEKLNQAGISLERGVRTNSETGEKHIYGIPLRSLPGASELMGMDTKDYYLCVFHNTGNDENVYRFMELLVDELLASSEGLPVPAEFTLKSLVCYSSVQPAAAIQLDLTADGLQVLVQTEREGKSSITYAPIDLLAQAEALMESCGVRAWDSRSDTAAPADGVRTFHFSAAFSDGTTLEASGSEPLPEDFDAFLEGLTALVEDASAPAE